jgi:hypothetical protein
MMKNRIIISSFILLLIISNDICSQIQFRETVWLQLERELFLCGDEISFRADLLENDTYKPSVLSTDLRLELIDAQSNIIKQYNLALESAEVSGTIDIPANLKTGWYYLRGYTNWMRNFDEKYFTVRAIRIFNPGDESFKADQTAGEINRYQAYAENFLKDNIELSIKDESIKQGAPEISITEKNGYLDVDIYNTQDDVEYKVLIHRLYSWSWYNSGRPVNSQLSFRVPLKDIPTGISQITILDEENNEIFRRLWSDYSESQASIIIEADDNNIIAGSEQSFVFSKSFNSESNDSNNLNVLVHAATPGSGIYNYFPGLPGWPATGEIPSADEAFRAWLAANTYAPGTAAAFFREDPGYPAPPTFNKNVNNGITYYPDTRSGIIRGRASDNQGNPLVNKNIAMTILNENLFCTAKIDRKGFFAFTFPGLHGNKDFFLNFVDEDDPSWNIKIEDTYADITGIPERGGVYFTDEEMKFLEDQYLILQLRNIYYETDSADAEVVNDSRPDEYSFYGFPDFSVDIDEYIKLPDLREVFLEVVPLVAIRQREGHYSLILNGNNFLINNLPALVLLDGIPLCEYNDLLNLPPDRIARIEGINDYFVHGDIVITGIVNIISRNRDFAGLEMPQSALISSIQLSDTLAGNSLNKTAEKTGYPVIDNVIIWVKLEAASDESSVTIKMNDYTGKHVISIYGFDSDGRWHRGVRSFTLY